MPKFTEKVANALSLPKEIVLDFPVVTAVGQGEISIENYKSLLEFTGAQIRVRTGTGTIVIAGDNLVLRQITLESLQITGQVSGILWTV